MVKVPFSPPYINEEMIDAVAEVLRSGWITTGPKTKQLEKELEEYAEIKKVLCVNSATGGMELMLRWLGVGPGDEVIIPAYTYTATANVVVHTGATPIMADIKSKDFNIDVQDVAKKITSKTKVILPVDLGGMPVDYDALHQLVNSEEIRKLFSPSTKNQKKIGRITILTDGAHSLGAKYKGSSSASIPDITVFSFHTVKNLTTVEGGAICLNLNDKFDHQEVYKYLNAICLHGQTKDALAKFGKNSWEYDVLEAGYKYNMPDTLAVLGLIQLRMYDKILARRKEIFASYNKGFIGNSWAELQVFEDKKRMSSYHLFLLRIRDISLEQRNELISNIAENDVAVNVHYKPLPLLTFYKNQGFRIDDYPVSKDSFEREITLPVFYTMTDEQVNRVIEVVVEEVEKILF